MARTKLAELAVRGTAVALLALGAAVSPVAACTADGAGATTGSGVFASEAAYAPATVRLWLTDKPADGVEAVIVTVSRVDARFKPDGAPGAHLVTLTNTPLTIDLLALQGGGLGSLGTSTMPPGRLTEFRLVVSDSYVVVQGQSVPVKIPSGAETGLKLKGDVEIVEGGSTDIVFDFDAEKSLHPTGKGFDLRPVIRFGTSTAPPGVDRSQDFFQGAERALSFIRLEELRAIGDRHSAEIIGLPGLVDFGIGLDAPNRRLVFVALAEDGADIPAFPSSLEGVPVFVRLTTTIEPSHGGDNCAGGFCHDEQLTLPVTMGNAAADSDKCVACSLGFKACVGPGIDSFITAQHCVFNATNCEGVPYGSDAFMHRSCTGSVVGTLWDVGDSAFETCSGKLTLDSAVFTTTKALTTNVVRDIGIPSFVAGVPQVGDMVQKSGRATGKTFGQVEVVGISSNYVLNYPDPQGACCNKKLPFANSALLWIVPPGQADANIGTHAKPSATACPSAVEDADGKCNWSQKGDSGAAVLTLGSLPQIVGLQVAQSDGGAAGQAVAVSKIAAQFGLDFDLTHCNGALQCTFQTLAAESTGEAQGLGDLRKIRDDILTPSPDGAVFVALYEEHTAEAAGIVVRHPMLFLRARKLMKKLETSCHVLAGTKKTWIAKGDMDEVDALLADFGARGSPGLGAAMAKVRTALHDEQMMEKFGVFVQ